MLDITGEVKQINTKCGKKIMQAPKVVDCPTLKADMFDEVCDCARELLDAKRREGINYEKLFSK